MDKLNADRPSCNASVLPLLPQHLADLRNSGLSDAQIAACGFRSETDAAEIARLLGGRNTAKSATRYGPCLVIPYFAPDGAPMGYSRLKPDKPRPDRKQSAKVVKYESPVGKPNRAFFPPGTRAALADPSVPLIVTEGEKKGAAADQHGFACVALSGVWAWQLKRPKDAQGRGSGPRKLLPDLAAVAWRGRAVYIVFDSDLADKPEVQWAEWHLAEALREAGAVVRVVRLPAGADGAKVGLDDYLIAHTADELRQLLAGADTPERPTDDTRPEIVVANDEYRVNEEAVGALARDPDLFQRGGMLVYVVEAEADPEPAPDEPAPAFRRPDPTPLICDLPNPLLRERLTRFANWAQWRGSGEKAELVPAHPPDWCVSAVGCRRHWPSVRRLEAVVPHPVVLPSGALLVANGYDRGSRLLVALPASLTVSVPDRPTRADVSAAVGALSDVVADFPFDTPAHRAAWFAGLLTPLAWFAFSGPAPLFLTDANVRAAGKGLLTDVISLIVTGRRLPIMSYTNDREELRKRITTLAVEGDRLVLLDNLAGAVGNDILDAALTADTWKDRLLGGNKVFDGPLHVCWFGTGNNVQLHADTARRVCHIRMETSDERPEQKTGFKYADLRAHVRAHRGPLLSAALTILRGWFAAGGPTHGLTPWGSFEGWSAVVREAVVFAGLPDPGETRQALQSAADCEANAMTALLYALERMDPDRRGVTAGEIVEAIRKPADPPPEWTAELRTAVEELCGRIDSRALGYKFRHFIRRTFNGRAIDQNGEDRLKGNRWVVRAVSRPGRNAPEPSPASPASPATDPGPAGDAGDAGDVPAGRDKARHRFMNDDRPHDRRG